MKTDGIRFAVLGSGSEANGFIFEKDDFSFLVDNGYSLPEFRRRMDMLQFRQENLAFIFLTHHHSDHFKGVEALSRSLEIPVVTHKDMPLEGFCRKQGLHRLDIEPGREYTFNFLKFRCFETSHDSACSLGYHFNLAGQVFTIITDTGILSQEMQNLAMISDYLFLESNYSPELLHNGPYPEFLKQRILSETGHLSNLDAAAFMSKLSSIQNNRLRKIFLCHLSENNNSPDKVKEELGRMYDGTIPFSVCTRNDCIKHSSLI